jgi:hypothetical protein
MNFEEILDMRDLRDLYQDSLNQQFRVLGREAFRMCMDPELEKHFYAFLEPRNSYRQAANKIANSVLSISKHEDPRIVGVHVRNFEGDCIDRAQSIHSTKSAPSIVNMCNAGWPLVQNVMQAFRLEENRAVLYISSDGQRPDILRTYQQDSNSPLVKFSDDFNTPNLFKPAVDMLVLMQSVIFIGTSQSTFSTNIANWRSSEVSGKMGWNILSWPMLERDTSFDSYWKCHHSNYWCETADEKLNC